MEAKRNEKTKKEWTTPNLLEYGSLEKITGDSPPPKAFGGDDGASWQSQSTGWVS